MSYLSVAFKDKTVLQTKLQINASTCPELFGHSGAHNIGLQYDGLSAYSEAQLG